MRDIRTEAIAPLRIPVGTERMSSMGRYETNSPGVFKIRDATHI